ISNLAAALGLDPERLRKLGKGKDAYDDRLAYLIHIKDTDKHPYSPEEVVSIVVDGEGKSYAEYYKKRRSEWLVGRAKKNKKKAELKIDEVLGKIRAGEITKRQMLLTPELYSIYGQYKRQCNDAFNTYAERAAALTEQALENHEFKIATFFFYGETESGKSRLARECVKAISKIQGGGKWRYRKTAATNALDGYAGEEIVWMDDARGNTMKASDWLTYMDQFNISPLSARYNNVLPACRVILITSTKSPLEFFYDSREDVNQFLRRIMAMIHIHDNGNSKEYVDSIVNISRPVSCEKRMELVGSSENAPLALVSREFKGDGVDYDIGQAAEKVCELVAEASDKSLLVAEAGPPIEVVRSSDPEWYLHLPEPDETSDEDNQSPKLPLITRLAA
ncbi:MAG: hypothetical protein IKW79_04710, partial [Schwartzia sp.]|nr:hypothetical protein [Schwartzia sp. (in: firmicutes)]